MRGAARVAWSALAALALVTAPVACAAEDPTLPPDLGASSEPAGTLAEPASVMTSEAELRDEQDDAGAPLFGLAPQVVDLAGGGERPPPHPWLPRLRLRKLPGAAADTGEGAAAGGSAPGDGR